MTSLPVEQLNKQLLEASEKGDSRVVMALLDSGADVNVMNEYGAHAIHVAAQGQHDEVIKILMSKNVDYNATTEDGLTALHFAARQGYLETVNTLIDNGADVNVLGLRYGRTALHYAAEQGRQEVVEVLLKAGAVKTLKDVTGSTPFELAEKKGHIGTAAIL